MTLAPDREQAERFIGALTGDPASAVTWQLFDDDADRKDPALARVFHGTLAEGWAELCDLNAAGAGVYLMVNEGTGDGRREANVRALRALFADDDSGSLTLDALHLAPSIVVQSRNGLHAYWNLRPGEQLDAFKPAQKALAASLGTDPAVNDLPRVMRVPGFLHMKDRTNPFPVTVVEARPSAYSIAEVLEGNRAAEPATVERPTPAGQEWGEPITSGSGDAFLRAQAAMLKRDPAAKGERNSAAYGTACYLGDFDLTEDQSLALLRLWNMRNDPPLEEAELSQVHADAEKYRKHPRGQKLGSEPTAAPSAPVVFEPPRLVVPVRLTLDAICNPPREEFVIGTMIPFAKSSVIFGPTSVGKSALSAQIAVAFAAGAESLWGLRLFPGGGPVLIYSAEDSLDDWARKVAAIRHAGGIDVERALERLWVVDQSEGIARLSEVVTVRTGDPESSVTRRVARPTEEQDRLIDAARQVGAKFMLVETASRLVEDEDNASFSALQSSLGRIGRETSAALLTSHHATKAASKDNDNSIENARGGGAFIYNARNALSLFPAEQEMAQAYGDRFLPEDVVTLSHGKPTSSTRRTAPVVLVRCDAMYGAVFRRPEDVAHTPEEIEAHNRRMAEKRSQEQEQLERLYSVVADMVRLGPVSQSRLRERVTDIGVHKRKLDALVLLAVERGVLRTGTWTGGRGKSIELGADPRRAANAIPGTTWDDHEAA